MSRRVIIDLVMLVGGVPGHQILQGLFKIADQTRFVFIYDQSGRGVGIKNYHYSLFDAAFIKRPRKRSRDVYELNWFFAFERNSFFKRPQVYPPSLNLKFSRV